MFLALTYCYLLLGLSSGLSQIVPELSKQVILESDWTRDTEPSLSCVVSSSEAEEWVNDVEENSRNLASPQNSDFQNISDQKRKLSFELSYEPGSQSSFDPYGFKLSPEHASHTLLDPDEAELSPEPTENDPYGFDITSSKTVRDSDPYGFKLSPEEENQEVLEYCGHNNQEAMDLCTYDSIEQVEPSNYSNQEILEPNTYENQDVLVHYSHNDCIMLDLYNSGNKEVLESSSFDNRELVNNESQEYLSHDHEEVVRHCSNISNQELLEPCGNKEAMQSCSNGSLELLDFSCPENQEVLDCDNCGNQELLDFSHKVNQDILVSGSHDNQELMSLGGNERHELLGLGSHDNHEVLDFLNKDDFTEANNNKCGVKQELNVRLINNSSDSSDSDVASEDLLGLELDSSICTTSTTNTSTCDSFNIANQDLATSNAPTRHNLLAEIDLGSVFGAGGYIGCPDVADDLEPQDRRQTNSVTGPVQPVIPVRPPRPSLRVSWKSHKLGDIQNIVI